MKGSASTEDYAHPQHGLADPLPSGLSLAELYSLVYAPVKHRCRTLLGNQQDAEDATHEVFRRAAERLAEIEQPLRWMLRVASNICHNELKRRRREQGAMDREGLRLRSVTVPDPAELVPELAVLHQLLAPLSPAERAVVLRRWLHGDTLEEAAGELGIAGSTARNLMLRARRKVGEGVRRYTSGLGSSLGGVLAGSRRRLARLGLPGRLNRQACSDMAPRLGWLCEVAVPAVVVLNLLQAPPVSASSPPPAPAVPAVQAVPQPPPAAVALAVVAPPPATGAVATIAPSRAPAAGPSRSGATGGTPVAPHGPALTAVSGPGAVAVAGPPVGPRLNVPVQVSGCVSSGLLASVCHALP